MKRASCIIAIFICASLISCITATSMKTPKGFAHFDRESEFRAVSSDNVYMKIISLSEDGIDQSSPLSVWAEEIDRVLSSKGYLRTGKGDFVFASGEKGVFGEYDIIFNGETWCYYCCVFSAGGKIYVAEASGEKGRYLQKKSDILTSFAGFTMK